MQGYPACVTLTRTDSKAIEYVDLDMKSAESEGVDQAVALKYMRLKFERQGFEHFVVVQYRSGSKRYLFATKSEFARKLQELLLRTTDERHKTRERTSLGELLHPKRGNLISNETMLRGNHVREAIEDARCEARRRRDGTGPRM